MTDDKIMGILFPTDRKFYYLERGVLSHANAIDKLRNILIARSLIRINDSGAFSPKTKVMSLADAKYQGFEIEVIYINNHTKTSVTKEDSVPSKSPWEQDW